MDSKIANAIALTNHPVALVWADAVPEGAVPLQAGTLGLRHVAVCGGRCQGACGRF